MREHDGTVRRIEVGDWANYVELASVAFYGSWLNRIEAQSTESPYFARNDTDHGSHRHQANMIRRYITWRYRHVTDPLQRKVVKREAPPNGRRRRFA